jgi:hypothetical protein
MARTYAILAEDSRYRAPSITCATVEPGTDIRAMAWERLQETRHHLSVEVMLDDKVVLKLTRPERTNPSAERGQGGLNLSA